MELDPRPTRILFVDDEAEVLDGIRDALQRDRKRWDPSFAVGPDAALAELARGEFDIVVSDMHMPGMDGRELLQRVRELQPWALRLVLSGHADRATLGRAHSVAHLFLSKPCEPVVLRGMLDRATDLSRRIRGNAVRRVIASLPSLPRTPEPIWPASPLDIDNQPSPVARILAREPLTSERFLRMSNAIFGIKSAFSDTDRAIVQLGADVAGAIVIAAQAFADFEALGVPKEQVERIQDHSLLTAWLSSSMLEDPDDARTAFTAGLLHDLGRLLLTLAARADRPRGDDLEEEERLGVTHADLGAYLLGQWGLPLPVVEAVAHHHHPPAVSGSFSVPWAVHLADSLVYEAEGGKANVLSALQTGRTTVRFMTDLERRMKTARSQLTGRAEARGAVFNR
jgi:putative nucleotidyltransferase with HDIG domain